HRGPELLQQIADMPFRPRHDSNGLCEFALYRAFDNGARVAQGQLHDECSPFSRLAVGVNGPAVRAHDPRNETEPETEAFLRRCLLPGSAHSIEPVENMRQVLGRNSLPRVFDAYLGDLIAPVENDTDAPARRRELHGIRQEVGKHAVQLDAIEFPRAVRDALLEAQIDLSAFRRNLELIDDVFNDLSQIQMLLLQNDLAGLGLRQQQECTDDLRQALDIVQ